MYICTVGLTLSIVEDELEVKEGENLNIRCLPTSETVVVVWKIPASATANFHHPSNHTITLRNAKTDHEGNYTCSVLGDEEEVISTATASVDVLESKSL